MQQAARIGIDVGGTFTDGVMVENGRVTVAKVRSEPEDIASGILDCCKKLGVDFHNAEMFIHGTTVCTNAIIERSGPPTAHITTTGFRDILYIRRGNTEPYNLHWQPPTPVVRRRNIYEVPERLAWDGSVITPLDEEAAHRVAQIIKEKGYKAVSVTFLHSYANPAHELRMKEILEKTCVDIDICISYEVLPHYREFERSSTTAVNAYLMPLMRRYLAELSTRAHQSGFGHNLLVMQSNGGLMTVTEAERMPARTVRSGPAGGAIAGAYLGKQMGLNSAILVDMGGTSTDVSVLIDARARWTPEIEFSWGVPIRFPSIEIHSVGAGGGSVAWVDAGRFLKVGPQSAGAVPGPACYGQGGLEPTTTDAQVVLGRLNPESLLGGDMQIRQDLASEAIDRAVAKPLGMDTVEAALGILRVNTNNIIQAIRLMTVNRGIDPRNSCLVAFGGSGPLYAADVARLLSIPKIVAPLYSGVMSALGMVLADHQYDKSTTLLVREHQLQFEAIEQLFRDFESELNQHLEDAGISTENRSIERFLDMRYDGQGYELPIPLPVGTHHEVTVPVTRRPFDQEAFEVAKQKFHDLHQREFGWQDKTWPLELVFARASATGSVAGKPLLSAPSNGGAGAQATTGSRSCYFLESEGPLMTPILDRALLRPGESFNGPAIIEQMDTTTIVPPGFTVQVDNGSNLVLEQMSGR
jgi:N-methylhydantoinase A